LDRIVRGTAATVLVTFQNDGVATDPVPATATVEILRDNGTVLVPAGTATVKPASTTGKFTYTLTPAQTALLDALTVKWTANLAGQSQTLTTHVEIAGGVLFSLAAARALRPLDNTTTYPADKIAEYRTLAETALEDACGVAFVPRYARRTFGGSGADSLVMPYPRVSAIRSGKLDGTAFTGAELATILPQPDGTLYWSTRWALGVGNYELIYEHGHPYPPPRVSRAALLLAKQWLVDGPIDNRATSMATEDGTFSLVTPGIRGSVFGIPEVDAVVQQYGYPTVFA